MDIHIYTHTHTNRYVDIILESQIQMFCSQDWFSIFSLVLGWLFFNLDSRISSIFSPFLFGISFLSPFAQDQLYSTFLITYILSLSLSFFFFFVVDPAILITGRLGWGRRVYSDHGVWLQFSEDKWGYMAFFRTHNSYYLNLYLITAF